MAARAEPFDFAIVGAGIAGASVGWRLAGHASVVLLERESQPGYHTTGRSAALFMESYGPPGVQALTRASRAFYEEPSPDFVATPILAPRDVLHVAARGQRGLLDHLKTGSGAGRCSFVDPDQMRALVPVLRSDAIEAGLLESGAADIDVHALHQGFLRGFGRRGGTLRTRAEVAALTRDNNAWRITLADGQNLAARHLVNAAGAWADVLAAMAGVRPVGLQPKRRSAFTFAPPPDTGVASWPAVVGADESYYFKPDAGQLLGSPANADPAPPHDVQPEQIDVATGIFRIEQVTTMTIRRPSHTWAGLRSFVSDGELVIGWDDERSGERSTRRSAGPGFFWLAGQGGYGIQSAAAASLLALDLLLGQPVSDELRAEGLDADSMRPGRLQS